MQRWAVLFGLLLVGCAGNQPRAAAGGGGDDGGGAVDDATSGAESDVAPGPSGDDGATGDAPGDASPEGSDAGTPYVTCTTSGDAGADAGCYAISCDVGGVHTLQANRDRLLADLARRKCTDSCTLWSVLNLAERYTFLMDTAYFGDTSSRLYPPGAGNLETALDHAVALYSINGPMAGQGVDGSGRGGNDYNRIYLGFDDLAKCVMRNFAEANPSAAPGYNEWVKSDDVAGPHAPFTQREMIFWYKALYDLQSEGPQFHHWHQDSDFNQAGIDQRLGVCGNTDRSLVESTIAFDSFHNSDVLGDYSGRGGYGWQIVTQHVSIDPQWSYAPSGCAATPPVNTDPYGGGTFNGMGPTQGSDGGCSAGWMGDAACAP